MEPENVGILLFMVFFGWLIYRATVESVAKVQLYSAQAAYLRNHDALPVINV